MERLNPGHVLRIRELEGTIYRTINIVLKVIKPFVSLEEKMSHQSAAKSVF